MEQTLLDTIYLFNLEAQRIENHKPGSSITFTLSYEGKGRYGDGPKAQLTCQFYTGRNYETVEAASLDTLMNEVARRLGFADKQAVAIDAINATLTALPAPTEAL